MITTLGGEESDGGIIHKNEIWVITKKTNHFDIREWNSTKNSVIFGKRHLRPVLADTDYLVWVSISFRYRY